VILTRDKIFEEIAAGSIVIDPFSEDMVGPASVDLHLDNEIRVTASSSTPIDVVDDVDFRVHSNVQTLDEPFPLASGQTILGITRERIKLASNLCGWLEGRSRFARIGLMIHVTAGFVSPGVDNRQVLEISNVSDRTLNIHAGTRLCQIVLQRTDGNAVYEGRYSKQLKV
jgi:dCTP deaminase